MAGSDEKKEEEKAGEARSTLGPASRALLSCVCMPQLADIILAARPGGVSAEVSTVTRQGPLFLPPPPPPPPPLSFWPRWNPHPPSCVSPSQKEVPLLNHRFTTFHAPRIPLRSFPWSLGSSLCHVAQSEPSLGRITQLSMGGQMTIIRLHSSGPHLKRQERSPGGLR